MKETVSIHDVVDKVSEEFTYGKEVFYENMEETPQIEEILQSREETYGSFFLNSLVTQGIKADLHMAGNWKKMSSSHKEALEMIAHKMSRIANGDSNYKDSWLDIQGYAELALKECK